MKRLMSYFTAYKKESALAPLFKMIEALFELMVPLVVASIIDRGIGGSDVAHIWKMGLVLLVLGVVGLSSALTAQYYAAKAAVGVATGMRAALFAHIQRLSYAGLDKLGASTMITRMTNDIAQVQSGVNLTLRLFLRSPIIVFGAMVMAFTVDVQAAWTFVVLIPLLSAVVFGIMLYTMPMYRGVQGALDKLLGATRENLSGVRVVRAFGREGAQIQALGEKNSALTAMQKAAGRISALMNPLTYLLVNAALIALLYVGAVRVDGGIITQGAVVALVSYMAQILVELVKLANLIITMTKAYACWSRVETMLNEDEGIERSGRGVTADAAAPAVEFEGVSMRYPGAGADALTDITFSVPRGATVGVIGGTGSGKSTIVNLIPAFYDATAGRVLVEGADVRDWKKDELRARIGVVAQKAVLFGGTVRDNVKRGCEGATDAQVIEALKAAQAWEFVSEKPGALDYAVASHGSNLSGGQKQRMTIARALVRGADILILDDSASALDLATDARLRAAIREIGQQKTVFIVSQRTASIRQADLILVLEDGHIAGQGTHEALLESCQVYQEIYYSQFPKEAV